MSKTKQSNIEEISCVVNNDIHKKKYNVKDIDDTIKPLNEKQKTFFDAFDRNVPIITQIGSAGTGKTFNAIYKALKEVFDQGVYQKLIIVRSPVESRSIGFLKGTAEEKIAAYERPYRDIIEQLITCDNKNGHYDNLKALGYVEFMPTSFLRGVTFDNSIIIVDEAQNADFGELFTIATRIGNNTKMILCGDTLQNDLARKREKSGLNDFMTILDMMEDATSEKITYFPDDVVRSDLVKSLLMAYEKFMTEKMAR